MSTETERIISTPSRGGMDLEWINRQAGALQELNNRGLLPTVEDPKTHEKKALAFQTGRQMLGELALFFLRGLDANLRVMLAEENAYRQQQMAEQIHRQIEAKKAAEAANPTTKTGEGDGLPRGVGTELRDLIPVATDKSTEERAAYVEGVEDGRTHPAPEAPVDPQPPAQE